MTLERRTVPAGRPAQARATVESGVRMSGSRTACLGDRRQHTQGEALFLVIEDGVRESTQGWREVLQGMRPRGQRCDWRSMSAAATTSSPGTCRGVCPIRLVKGGLCGVAHRLGVNLPSGRSRRDTYD